MCKKFTLLIFIILISGLAAVQAQDSYIIVHALNPEGVEIGSIEGMPGFSFSVEILDDGLYGESLIGYAPVDSQTHNEPIRIDPGTHTIKARFNGMTKEKVLTVAPGETQTLTFVFERTEFDLVSYINSVGPNINFACDLYSSGWSEMVRRFSIQGEDPGAVYNRSITLSFSEDNSSTSKHSFECSYSGGQFRASTSVSMSWTIPNPYPVPWAWWAVEADTWINDIRGFGTTMEVPPPNLPKSGTFDFWHIQRIFDGRLGTFKLIPSDITTTRWYGIIYNNGGTLWPLETWDNQYIIDLIPEQADIIAAEFDIIAPTIMLQKASSLGDPTSGSASSSSEWSGTISSLKMSSVPYDLLGTGIHCGGGGPQPPECSFSAENPVWQNEDDNMILPYDEVDLKFMFTNTASNSVTNVRVDFIDSDLVHFVKHSEAIGTIAPGATFYTTNTIRIAGTDNSEIMNNIIDFNGSGQLSLEGKMEVHVKADQCPEPCVFQNLVPVDESGTTQFIQYPRFIDTMDSCPTGDIGNYYLQGDHDFHHPFDPLVRKYAVEAAVWPNSIFPDKVSDVVWNIARYIDGLVDDKDPGYAYNDIIIAKAIENKILTPGGRNYGFICIAQAYLFGSFARTIGVPAREIDVAIGRSIFQAGQNVYGILYSQEAAIQVWCGGPGWQFYDTFLERSSLEGYLEKDVTVDDKPCIKYRSWYSFCQAFYPVWDWLGHNFMIFINGKPIAFATWEHLQDGVKKGIIIKLGSPVTTYINDTEGNVTGYVDGDILEEIPDSFYIPAGTRFYTNSGDPTAFWDANETIFVGGDTGIRNYSTVITGTDDGHYELILAYVHADGQIDGSTIQFDIRKGETQTYDISVNSSGEISVVGVPARIDIDPDTINLSAPSRWVTCYIGLPEGFDVNLIDGETVQLDGIPSYIGKEGWAQAEANQWNIVDHDGDGIPERMVKFDSLGVELLLSPGNATVTVCGQLFDGTNFERTDTIKVINKRVK